MPTTTKPRTEVLSEQLAHLVAMRTVSDDLEANHEAFDYIAKYLEDRGMHVRRFDPTPRRYEALIASTRADNAKHPAVLLAAHVDVMTGPDHLFTMREEHGKYLGRGVMDMKCAIVSYLQLVDELKDRLNEYDFAIMITSDEELGNRDGVNGVREFVKADYRPGVVVLPDGGDNWHLETVSNGYLHYTVEAHGVSGHSSRPWLGENASEKLVAALHDLRQHFLDQGPDTDTMNIGPIKTAEGPANRIPEYAVADLSIRLKHRGSLERWRKELNRLAADHEVKVYERAVFDVIFNELENPYVRRFADITEQVTGVKTEGFHSYAGSDARWFAEIGVPYANGYPKGGGHHSDGEWLAVEALGQFYEITRRYVEEIAKSHN